MEKIRLWQILQYLDQGDCPNNRIQLVTSYHEWTEPDEVFVDSELLEPFYEYAVTDMNCEQSLKDGGPVLRVSVEKVEQNLSILSGGKAA